MRPLDAAEPAEPEAVGALEPQEDFEQFLLPLLREMREGVAALSRGRAALRARGGWWAAEAARARTQTRGEASEQSALNRLHEPSGRARCEAAEDEAGEVAQVAEMLVQLVRRIQSGGAS